MASRSERSYSPRVARDRRSRALPGRGRDAEVGEIVREVDQVLVAETGQLLGHGASVAQPRPALVVAHGLEEIVLALIGETRHLLAPGEVLIVADAARMAQGEPAAAREAGGIGRLLAGRRGRQLGHAIGEGGEIAVGQPLGGGDHGRVVAAAFAEEEELGDHEERRLPSERGRLGNARLAVRAVAGEADREALVHRLGGGPGHGQEDGGEDQREEPAEAGREQRRRRFRPAGDRHFWEVTRYTAPAWASETRSEPSFSTSTSTGLPGYELFSTRPVRKGSMDLTVPSGLRNTATTSAAYFLVRFHGPWRAMKMAP